MTEPRDMSPGRLMAEATRLLAGSLNELVPQEAQLHLLKAQRELLLAIGAVLDHNSTRTVRQPRAGKRAAGKSTGQRRRPEPVQLD